jgi:hypothetical protein
MKVAIRPIAGALGRLLCPEASAQQPRPVGAYKHFKSSNIIIDLDVCRSVC